MKQAEDTPGLVTVKYVGYEQEQTCPDCRGTATRRDFGSDVATTHPCWRCCPNAARRDNLTSAIVAIALLVLIGLFIWWILS